MQENGIQLVSGQNCSPQFAVQEFMATWQMHHKKSPGWFYHYVQSCHPDEPITGEQAHTIEKDFAAQAWPDSRKNITHTTPSGRKCRDDRLHEEKYLKESMEQEFEQRRKIVFERTEAAQYANRTAAAGAEYTGASHAGRVDTVAGSAVWTVRPASGATSLGKHQPILYATQEQMREMGRLRIEVVQAGKRKEKCFSLPRIHLPELRFRPRWLVLLPISVALWAIWSSLDTIWNAFSLLLP